MAGRPQVKPSGVPDGSEPHMQSERSSDGQAVFGRSPPVSVCRTAAGPTGALPSTKHHKEDVREVRCVCTARGFPEDRNAQTKTQIRGSPERRLT